MEVIVLYNSHWEGDCLNDLIPNKFLYPCNVNKLVVVSPPSDIMKYGMILCAYASPLAIMQHATLRSIVVKQQHMLTCEKVEVEVIITLSQYY